MCKGTSGSIHDKFDISPREARIAAKLYLRSQLLTIAKGKSYIYPDSQAEKKVNDEVMSLIETLTEDVSQCPTTSSFDDCIVLAKAIEEYRLDTEQ